MLQTHKSTKKQPTKYHRLPYLILFATPYREAQDTPATKAVNKAAPRL